MSALSVSEADRGRSSAYVHSLVGRLVRVRIGIQPLWRAIDTSSTAVRSSTLSNSAAADFSSISRKRRRAIAAVDALRDDISTIANAINVGAFRRSADFRTSALEKWAFRAQITLRTRESSEGRFAWYDDGDVYPRLLQSIISDGDQLLVAAAQSALHRPKRSCVRNGRFAKDRTLNYQTHERIKHFAVPTHDTRDNDAATADDLFKSLFAANAAQTN